MAVAWVVQQRTGNSGWVDTIWTFSLGPGRRRQRAMADRGRRAERAAMAGRGAGRDLVAAARRAYRDAHRRDIRRSALCRLRQGVGRRCAAQDVHLPAEPGASGRSRWRLRFLSRRGFRPALRLQDYLGALILLIGIAGEALADAQLKRFRTDPANKGRVCDAGLWRWSRHPNYFFEWFGWLAYPVIAHLVDPLIIRGAGDAAGAGLHVLDAGPRHRHPAAGGADAALARRALSRLSVAYQSRSSRCRRTHERDVKGVAT